MANTPSIRTVTPGADDEIELVARRMGETLDEVLGADRTTARYSHAWLVGRVRQHLASGELNGQVFVAEVGGAIVGHAIVRVDEDSLGKPIGLFSTLFVAGPSRRRGIARALVERGETWMRDRRMTIAETYTDKGNRKLQRLFVGLGYALRPMPNNFVALSKELISRPG